MHIKTILKEKSLGILLPFLHIGGSVCGTFGKGVKEWIKKLITMGLNTGNFTFSPTDSKDLHTVHHLVLPLTHGFLTDDLIEKGFILISNKEN